MTPKRPALLLALALSAACGGGGGGTATPPPAGTNTPPTIDSAAPSAARAGQAWTHVFAVSGRPDPTVTVTGMPAWMSFDGALTLSGTPALADEGPGATVTATASNGVGTDATQAFIVEVRSEPRLTLDPTPTGVVGTAYSHTLAAAGHPAPTIAVDGLPAWLSFDGTTLSGTPGAADAGTHALTVRASNGVGTDAVLGIDVRILAPTTVLAPLTSAPVWSRTEANDGDADESTFDAGTVQWNTLTLPTPPANANAAILLLRGSATGKTSTIPDERTAIRLQVREPGGPEPDHRALRINSLEDGWLTEQQNAILVPLGPGGTVEVSWEIRLSGISAVIDKANLEIHLQGWLTGAVSVNTPFVSDSGLELFHREIDPGVIPDLSDAQTWIPLSVPNGAGARAAVLNLHGRAKGNNSRLKIEVRTPGGIEPVSSQLLVEGTGSGANRDRNLVLVPLDADGNFEMRYELDADSNDETSLSIHLQGVVRADWDVKSPGTFDWRVVRRDLNDVGSSDVGFWTQTVLPQVPTGATAVILGLTGRAQGLANAQFAKASVKLRPPGGAEPEVAALEMTAVSDTDEYRGKSLVLLPLDTSGSIEYLISLAGTGIPLGANDDARISIYVQGYIVD